MLRQSGMVLVLLLAAVTYTLTAAPTQANEGEANVRQELKSRFFPIVNHIKNHYIDEISPDTLMRAGLRGVFRSLDPASEFTISGTVQSWNNSFTTFEQVARTVDRHAFYAVGADTLIRYGIAGMMSILDPDTVFMEKLSLDNFHINTRGEYGGLGFRIQVVYPDSAIAVWSLLHGDTPAARAGVKSGDLIVAIDDSSTVGMSASDAASLMRGPADTSVKLTLRRAGHEHPMDIIVTRKVVHVHSVPYYGMFADSTGYIKLSQFQHKCSEEIHEALVELGARGMKRLIFDLRQNGGGYLQEAVEVADLFLPKDRLVVYTAGRAFRDTSFHRTRREPVFGDGPMIILVDGLSASASEIVSGAIQDWDRGLVLGTPTVGKGSVQQSVSVGDRAELKLTIAAYFIPSGRSIDKRMRKDSTLVAMADRQYRTQRLGRIVHGAGGITPDIEMERRKATPLYRQLEGWRTLNSQFFRFSREYYLRHPEVTMDFVAGEETLAKFRNFVSENGFTYTSAMEVRLDQLTEEMEEEDEDGASRAGKHISRLSDEIEEMEERHWDENEELLTWKLTFDIREKLFGIERAYAYDITVDPQVQRAREILAETVEYDRWFQLHEIGHPETAVASAGDTTSVEVSESELQD
ncbi:MAG: S41 family peptidase [Candidatus Latescibacterota bacterium]|nr:S41 family peptidase [Candidatus Latescibacterota bacterium]